jgi:molecular chaperone GrpE
VSEPRKKPPRPPDEDIIFLETEGGEDVAQALEEAARAVTAVEAKQRRRGVEDGVTEVVTAVDPDPEPPSGGAPAFESKIGELQGQLAGVKERAITAEEETGRVREALLRKSADFDNLKRRTEKEKTDFFKFALAETFHDLLAVLDNFERALHHADASSQGDFKVGIEMIARQLSEVLKKYGVSEVPAKGLTFDPNVHEAVVREETGAVAPGTILAVLQRGYFLNDRLLRPARVKVAAASPPEGS